MSGAADPVHLTLAICGQRILLTRNADDVEDLHDLVLQSGGSHSGILVVRYDNDPRRELTPRGVVTSMGKLLAAQVPIDSQFTVLNHWR